MGDQCEGVTEGQRQWSQIYGLLDLSFLIFFSCEILLHLIADGVGYFRSSTLNSVDASTVLASLAFALFARYGGGPDLPLLRLFRLTRIVKMVGAYNRLMKMRDRILQLGFQRRSARGAGGVAREERFATRRRAEPCAGEEA